MKVMEVMLVMGVMQVIEVLHSAGHTICTDNIFLELSLYSLYMAIRVVIGPS